MIYKKIEQVTNEYKKAMVTGITGAFGFMIALTWRDFMIPYLELIDLRFKMLSVLVVTAVCTGGIALTGRLLK